MTSCLCIAETHFLAYLLSHLRVLLSLVNKGIFKLILHLYSKVNMTLLVFPLLLLKYVVTKIQGAIMILNAYPCLWN